MSVTILTLGESKAVFFGRKIAQEFDHRASTATELERAAIHQSIEDTAKGISVVLGVGISRKSVFENPEGAWTWAELAASNIQDECGRIGLVLSEFDNVGSTEGVMGHELLISGITDIIDHAVQLVKISCGIAQGEGDEDDLNQCLGSLCEALSTHGLVEDDLELPELVEK